MSRQSSLDVTLRDHFAAVADMHVTDERLEAVLHRTVATRQRRAWLWWWGRPLDGHPLARRSLLVALAAVLMIAAGATLALVGARLLDAPPPTGRFVATGMMGEARQYPATAILPDGRVLVAGGQDLDGLALATAETWDRATGEFSSTGSMTTARMGATATPLADGRVLVAGGTSDFAARFDTAELYDPATGRFTPTGRMATGHAQHAAVRLDDGRVLLVDRDGVAELYDPATGTFARTGGAPGLGDGATLTSIPGGALFIVADGVRAYVYDAAAGRFSRAGDLTTGRTQFWAAAPLADGRVLVVGGHDRMGEALTSADVFDPATGAFTPTGPLSAGRMQPTAVTLADGRVLVIGGMGEGDDPAELWDPASGRFEPVAGPAALSVGSGALLPDGRVLVIGLGERGAWLYEPGPAAAS